MNVQLLDRSIYRSDKDTVVTATSVFTAVAHCQMCCTLSDVLHMQVNCQTAQLAVSSQCIVDICDFVYHSQSITVLGHMDANRASVGPWVTQTSLRLKLRRAQSANLPVHTATGL